jgi:DNA-binding NtrC family response regulator
MTLACVCVGGGGGFSAGMTAALADEWDIVLCGYRRPDFDAFTTLAVLGAGGLDGPFIVVSGESDETAVAAMHASAADFVSRDHVDCLRVAAARCLRHRRAALSTTRRVT